MVRPPSSEVVSLQHRKSSMFCLVLGERRMNSPCLPDISIYLQLFVLLSSIREVEVACHYADVEITANLVDIFELPHPFRNIVQTF